MAKRNGKQKITVSEQRRKQAADAMPEVKRLVAQFGRIAVSNCLHKIKARDKEAAKLEKLKKDVAALEKSLR